MPAMMSYGADAGAMLVGLAVLPSLCTEACRRFRKRRPPSRVQMSEAHSTVPVVILLTDVAAALGSATLGAVVGAVSKGAAARRADRAQARDLFGQIANAAAQVESEIAVFRERRDAWRPNLHAAGQALLELGAAWHSGNMLSRAAQRADVTGRAGRPDRSHGHGYTRSTRKVYRRYMRSAWRLASARPPGTHRRRFELVSTRSSRGRGCAPRALRLPGCAGPCCRSAGRVHAPG